MTRASAMTLLCVMCILYTSSCRFIIKQPDDSGELSAGIVRSNTHSNFDKQGIGMKSIGSTVNLEELKRLCMSRLKNKAVSDSIEVLNQLLKCQYQQHKKQMNQMLKYEDQRLRGADTEIVKPYKRRYGEDIVNPHNFRFVHQPQPCTKDQTVIVSIHSAVKNIVYRNLIRNTWGNSKILTQYLSGVKAAKLIFILGLSNDTKDQTSIDYEAQMFDDIVQANFIDEYHNNTYKALYHLKWVSNGCPSVDVIIKSDDDVVFNMRKLPQFWKNFTRTTNVLYSSGKRLMIAGNQFGLGPLRDRKQKWYLSYEMYPYDTFPPWFQGMVYFITPTLAHKMFDLSYSTPYIFTDDVYIGILADRVHGIQRYDFSRYYNFVYDSLEKKQLKWLFEPYVFYHNPSVVEMYTLWSVNCNVEGCS